MDEVTIVIKNANLHIRIDSETKSKAETLYSSFGLTLTDAVIMFLRQSIMVKGLPFELRQPRYNAKTEIAIHEANEIMSGAIKTKTYSTLDDFYADLESDNEYDEV